jgi:putative hemolysin
VEASEDIRHALDRALASGHRRIPIYEDTLEHITGVVRLRDLTEASNQGTSDLRSIAMVPLIVPESKSITSLLKEMQEQNNHLAVVVDEYGVTAGLVTVEDVAEELLGTISDEDEPAELEKLGDKMWRAPGSLPVEDLEEIGLDVPDGDWNTVAGLMMGVAGQLLSPGDDVEVDGYLLTADSVRRRRVVQVSIERL